MMWTTTLSLLLAGAIVGFVGGMFFGQWVTLRDLRKWGYWK